LATQQSIKAYVDSQVTAQDLDFGGDSGTGAVDLDSQTFTIAGTANEIETSASGQTLTVGLPDNVTIAGDLTVDTDTLYVDSANNTVGFGTSSPQARIDSSAVSNFSVTYNDFTGDGLHIQSTGTAGDGAYAGGISFSRISADNNSRAAGIAAVQTDSDADRVGLAFFTHPDATTSNDLSEAMRIDAAQRVLIGHDTSKAVGSSSVSILQIHDNTAFASIARYTAGTGGPLFILGKAKSNTIGDNTVVADNDTLGNIRFAGADGTDLQSYAAQIVTEVDGTPGSNDMPGRLTFWTTADGASSSGERMRISQDGNVGIGITDTDYARLSVKGTFASAESTGFDSQVMYLTNDSASKLSGITMIAASDNGTIAQVGRIGTYNVHPATGYLGEMTFSTRDGLSMIEAMRIDQVQRVNIGGTQTAINGSSSKLQVLGDSKSTSLISSLRFSNDSGPPHFIFGKSRSGTISTVGTSVSSSDTLGYLAWAGDDGTDLGTVAAAIDVQVDGTPGSNDMPGRMRFFTTADGSQTPTERMRITQQGYVGINETSPNSGLHIKGSSSASWLTIENTLAGNYSIVDFLDHTGSRVGYVGTYNTTNSLFLYGAQDGPIEFFTNGANAGRIDSSQRLLIGTSTARTDFSGNTAGLQLEGTDLTGSSLAITRNTNNSFGSVIYINKTRGTSDGSDTIVSSGDTIGEIIFEGADGNELVRSAQINATVDSTPGLADMPGRLTFPTTADGASATSERMRIDKDGNLLVGKTSTTFATAGTNIGGTNGAHITRSGGVNLSLNRLGTDGEVLGFYNDSSISGYLGVSSNNIYVGSDDTGLYFNNGTNVIHSYNVTTKAGSTTDGTVSLGQDTVRFKDLYLSGGVYLGGTGAANKLDDYEEGTWTPTFAYSTTQPSTITYTIRDGEYTKVGNIVYVTGVIATSALSGGSGDFQINDLPFTVRNSLVSTGNEGSMIMRYKLGSAVDGKYVGYFNDGTTHCISWTNKSDISGTLSTANFSSSTSLRFDGWYRTDD
jgi:hypothetical protein